MNTGHFDAVIIGGGIFGCYAALFLSKKGLRVCLVEKENRLFTKASVVNQARLHSGYHYPRSVATAAMSDAHKARFTEEHRDFVNFSFEKFYAIDRHGSFTSPQQFERFCDYLQIRCEPVLTHPWFNFHRLEAVYKTEEFSFDPVRIANYYRQRVFSDPNITVALNSQILAASVKSQSWHMTVGQRSGAPQALEAPIVINATYAAINAVNAIFHLPEIEVSHEISEIGFITSPQFQQSGLTVMDGAFGSIMPYGKSGLLSLSSVAYTHHKVSYQNTPHFDCQRAVPPEFCSPSAPGICTECVARPKSNADKMLKQMLLYFSDQVQFQHLFSWFTIKTKLKANHIDDGRPTEISLLQREPAYYCLFAGKINSIYEVEKMVTI